MASDDRRYKRQPPHTTCAYLDHAASKVPALSDRFMPEPQPSIGRKRQRSEAAQRDGTSQPTTKRQRVARQSPPQPPLTIWDNVSKVWLTRRALQELDSRTRRVRPTPRPARQQAHRPVTRKYAAKVEQGRCSSQHTIDPLSSYGSQTARNITLFARQGGPDLSDLRNYPERGCPLVRRMSSRQSSSRGRGLDPATTPTTRPTTDTQRTKSTGPYDRQFEQILVDNGIYPDGYEYPDGGVPPLPDNWDDIAQRLAQPRPSLSPSRFSEGEFRRFKRADAQARKEKSVCDSVLPYIEGSIADGRCRSGGVPFGNLEALTDRPLTHGNPDVYYGARPEQLARGVREVLGCRIIPSTQDDLPVVPNFYTEVKGPDGSPAVASRQACYNGALGARGMHSLQMYGGTETAYDNHAYTITNTYHNGHLRMYTSHVGPLCAADGRSETYMNQVNAYSLIGNADNFRTGVTAYRNARDWAKDQRDTVISQANERFYAQAEASADSAGASPTLSFVTAEETEVSNVLTQESGTSLSEPAHVSRRYEESDGSVEEPAEYTLPAKRSTRASARQQAQRKRHNG